MVLNGYLLGFSLKKVVVEKMNHHHQSRVGPGPWRTGRLRRARRNHLTKIKPAVLAVIGAAQRHFLQGPNQFEGAIVESVLAFIVGTETTYQVHRLTQTALRDGLQTRRQQVHTRMQQRLCSMPNSVLVRSGLCPSLV